MRFPWQCPTCAAQLDNSIGAKMLTCPFCGSLLIADMEREKFYLVKNENSWYYFPKKYLHGNTGYIGYENGEEYYLYDGEWFLTQEERYRLIDENADCSGFEEISRDVVNYIWGSLPIIAPPGTEVITLKKDNLLCKRTKKHSYLFEIPK